MPRPHTNNDLIEAADLNYDKFLKLINSMTEIELSKEFDFSSDAKKKEAHWERDKNLRDILIHLHEWHNLMLDWVGGSTIGSYFVSVTSSHYDWAMKKLKAHRKMLNVK